MAELNEELRAAENTVFPPVDEDHVWCGLRSRLVGVSTCVDSCLDPSQRPACWLGKIAPGYEPREGEGE